MKRTFERQYQYDVAYMKMAAAFSELSYAKKRQVGAIIVSKDDQVISQGYNGMPAGWDNTCEYWDEKLNKYVTFPEVLHAETNAITKCAKFMSSTEGSTLYVTLSPCINCAKLIAQAGIVKVIFRDIYRDKSGLYFLEKCGIDICQLIIGGNEKYITDIEQMVETKYDYTNR